jgi:hypothetical protein
MIKHAFKGLLFLTISTGCCYANDECSNPNPYLQQTCENLKQSATEAQKARDKENEDTIAKHEKSVRKNIEEENKPPPAKQPDIPEWQKALKPPATPQNNEAHALDTPSGENATSNEPPPLTTLAPLGPTEFAGPKPITLPGGVNVIPTKPEKKGGTGTIKYY